MTDSTLYLIRNKFTAEGWQTVKRTYDKQGKAIQVIETQTQRMGKNYIKTARTTAGANIKTTETYGQMRQASDKVGKSLGRVTGQSGNMVKALKRAAIVAPIWLALRAAMMAVIQTIKQGAKYWMDFDKAMQKTEQVIHGFAGATSEAVDGLTEKIRNLSISTGQSMAKLAATFYRFGTVGLNYETSMQGMVASTKLANVMFGDNEQIAKVLAQTYRLLGESMDASIPVSKRMEVVGAQIYKLWKTNAFEINEFTGALERFLPTANMFNFEITDSLALLASLHTAGVKGTRAGRLLGSSMQKLVSNMGDVAQTLGVDVNPNIDNTFDMLMKTLGAVKKLNEAGSKIPDIENLTVFGGVRQRRAPMALVALYDILLENLKSINLESGQYSDLLTDIDSKNQDILNSVHKQAEIFGNLRKMAGEAFVQGIVGGEDFKDSLKKLNEYMQSDLIPNLKIMGDVIRKAFAPFNWLGNQLGNASTAASDLYMLITGNSKSTSSEMNKDLQKSITTLRTMQGVEKALTGKITDTNFIKGLIENVKKLKESLPEDERINLDRTISSLQTIIDQGYSVGMGIEDWRKKFAETDKIADDFAQRIKSIQEEINAGNIDAGTVGVFDPKSGNKVFVYANKLKSIGKENLTSNIKINSVIQEKLNLLQREVNYAELLSQGYSKSEISMSKLTDYISEQVKIHNATQGVIDGKVKAIKTETVLSEVLNKNYEKVANIFSNAIIPQERLLEIEKRRLEVVKARIKEERGAPDLSSETMKLYKIAKEYGANPARRISEFLQGKMDYQQFQYRDAFKIYEKEFGTDAEKYKALDYLKRGAGRSVPIQEEALRLPDLVKKYRMKRPEEDFQIPEVDKVSAKVEFKTTVNNKIEVKIPEGTQEDLANDIGKKVVESLKNDEELSKTLAKEIRPYI